MVFGIGLSLKSLGFHREQRDMGFLPCSQIPETNSFGTLRICQLQNPTKWVMLSWEYFTKEDFCKVQLTEKLASVRRGMKIIQGGPKFIVMHLVKGFHWRGAPQTGGHVSTWESLEKQFWGRWQKERERKTLKLKAEWSAQRQLRWQAEHGHIVEYHTATEHTT